jgi:WD40 repeat protein
MNATEFSSDEENESQSIFDVHFVKKKKTWTFEPISKLMMNNQNKKKIFDKKTKSYKKPFCDHEISSKIYDIQFTSCGSYVLTTSTDNYLKLWDFKNGRGLYSFNGCDLKSKCRPKLFFEDKLEKYLFNMKVSLFVDPMLEICIFGKHFQEKKIICLEMKK